MNILKFINIAKSISNMSKDPSTKVGAIIVDDDFTILSTGFNGFPRGVVDSYERLTDRPTKLKFISHAEANAIAQAARVGAKLKGSTLVITALHPCSNCAKLIIQAGIVRVITPVMDGESVNEQWIAERELSNVMFDEAGVEVIYY